MTPPDSDPRAGGVGEARTAAPFEPQALARIPLMILKRAQEYGLDPERLTRESGLGEAELKEPDGRVPLRKVRALWKLAVVQTGDEDLALRITSGVPLRSFGLIGYLMLHSQTLGKAFERLSKYSRIVTEGFAVHWESDSFGGRLTFVAATPGEQLRALPDSRLSSVLSSARELAGQPLSPREVHLPYARPSDTTVLDATFRSPLVFDQQMASLHFDSGAAELGIVTADETLAGYLDDLALRILRSIPANAPFQVQVHHQIWIALRSGSTDLARVADGLSVSPRTLQRRLREEGTSYAAVLDDVRRELATGLLRGGHLAVYEVAHLLGYSEPSTFHRAFRRWTGRSPRGYRNSGE